MNEGDIKFDGRRTKQVITKVYNIGSPNDPSLYQDVVGVLRRVKSDRRSKIGKTRPPYTWEVHLEREVVVRKFFDEDEAKAWAVAVLRLS